jgi:hypothetical protein
MRATKDRDKKDVMDDSTDDGPFTPLALLKIGERQYMEQLLRKGIVFCRTLATFQAMEKDDVGRADDGEGLIKSYGKEVTSIRATVSDRHFDFTPHSASLTLWNDDARGVHVYSLFLPLFNHPPITPGQRFTARLSVDREWWRFGDTYVLVKEPLEFVRRVEERAKQLGHLFGHGRVHYESLDGYAGTMGPFRKFDRLAYQCEYRLAVVTQPHTVDPLFLEIGAIEDIAMLGDQSSFEDGP